MGGAILFLLCGLLAAWMLLDFLVRPERSASRATLHLGVTNLMRLYENTASMTVYRKGSSAPMLRYERADLEGDGCVIDLEVLASSHMSANRESLAEEIRKQGFEPTLLGEHAEKGSPIFVVRIGVPDIWHRDAGGGITQCTDAALDVMGVGHDERFRLSFHGPRSVSRILESRERRKRGDDIAQEGAELSVPVGSSALGRLGWYLGYAAGVAARLMSVK